MRRKVEEIDGRKYGHGRKVNAKFGVNNMDLDKNRGAGFSGTDRGAGYYAIAAANAVTGDEWEPSRQQAARELQGNNTGSLRK